MNYAIIENGIVRNVIWLYPTTAYPNAVPCDGKSIQIGDIYDNGKFYRNGIEILSQVEDMKSALEILRVNS